MPSTSNDSTLIAALNDLLQLDHDAVEGYTIAIDRVRDARYRETLVEYRADHKRHIEELAALVRARGGLPTELPHPTGALKLAVQGLGAIGNDVSLLLAFKAVEGQVRDKYRRAAQRSLPSDVADVVTRAAADEEKHYAWVERTLHELGAGAGTLPHGVASAVEAVHKLIADPIEGVERAVMRRVGEVVGTTHSRGGAAAPLPTDGPTAADHGAGTPDTQNTPNQANRTGSSNTSNRADMSNTTDTTGMSNTASTASAASATSNADRGADGGRVEGAQRFIEALRALEENNDLERIVSLFDNSAELSNPMATTPHHGQEGARQFWRAYRDSFEEIHSDFSKVVETDGAAMLEWHSHGRIRGSEPIDYAGVSVLEMQDGKVRRFRAYFDTRPFDEHHTRAD